MIKLSCRLQYILTGSNIIWKYDPFKKIKTNSKICWFHIVVSRTYYTDTELVKSQSFFNAIVCKCISYFIKMVSK